MKHCFLHVGFHKTATTSFQLTLQHNRERLEQEGILLPKFQGKKQRLSANHSGQIRDLFDKNNKNLWEKSIFTNKPADARRKTIEEHCKSLNCLLEQHQDILISGEGISTMPKNSLIRLTSKLEEHGFLIKPFALVRAPYGYLTSALQQTIKNGKHHPLVGLTQTQDIASNHDFKIPSSLKSINSLNQVFGERMHYIPFKQATSYPGGPVLFLLKEVLQLKQADQYKLINANESKSNASTRLRNFLNLQQPHADQGELKDLFKAISPKSQKQKFLLTEQEFLLIEQEFKQIKSEIRSKLGKAFVEEQIEFSTQFTAQEANNLLSQLCRNLYRFAINK